jgi:hypothetical protein
MVRYLKYAEESDVLNGLDAAEAAGPRNAAGTSCIRQRGATVATKAGRVAEAEKSLKWLELLNLFRRVVPSMVYMLPQLPEPAIQPVKAAPGKESLTGCNGPIQGLWQCL